MKTIVRSLLLLFLAGCDLQGDLAGTAHGVEAPLGREEVALTLYVAAHTSACVGEALRPCLLVKERADGAWTFFYDSIEGFRHERGYAYTLRVARRPVADPPADGSSFAYRLLQVIEKTRA
jgi:hypothetical protein